MLVFELANFLEEIFQVNFRSIFSLAKYTNSGATLLVPEGNLICTCNLPDTFKELPFVECYSQNGIAKMGLFEGKNQTVFKKVSQLIIRHA